MCRDGSCSTGSESSLINLVTEGLRYAVPAIMAIKPWAKGFTGKKISQSAMNTSTSFQSYFSTNAKQSVRTNIFTEEGSCETYLAKSAYCGSSFFSWMNTNPGLVFFSKSMAWDGEVAAPRKSLVLFMDLYARAASRLLWLTTMNEGSKPFARHASRNFASSSMKSLLKSLRRLLEWSASSKIKNSPSTAIGFKTINFSPWALSSVLRRNLLLLLLDGLGKGGKPGSERD